MAPTPVMCWPRSYPPDTSTIAITFQPSVSFAVALRRVTDLGLLPGYNCGVEVGYPRQDGTRVIGMEPWRPQVSADDFARGHILYVLPGSISVGAPSNWSQVLAADAEIRSIQRLESIFPSEVYPSAGGAEPNTDRPLTQCPAPIPPTDVTPRTDLVLTAGQAGTLAHIQFAAPLDTYDAALETAATLGLTLADPCYLSRERDATGARTWQSMGEEDAFAKTHSLAVFTMQGLTSAHWRERLQATSGVVSITPLQPTCAS